MRLLHNKTLKLAEFLQPPPYAILSHTWGAEEVTLQEFDRVEAKSKLGWRKISEFCKKADAELGAAIEYGWADTCCIDKTSSAELSESINSMFKWYREAACCYAVLEDVEHTKDVAELSQRIRGSRWFTRGWTLQELLAPTEVKFFDKNWNFIGTKKQLAESITEITRIPERVLLSGSLEGCSIAQRMSWVSTRQTTRLEDIAYCLLGIFDVSMPMLYGEGEKAFIRLQEEILKESEDQSIFAWDSSSLDAQKVQIGVLSPSPRFFAESGSFGCLPYQKGGNVAISNQGIEIDLRVEKAQDWINHRLSRRITLACDIGGDISMRVGIWLLEDDKRPGFHVRTAEKIEHVPTYGESTHTQRITLAKLNRNISQRAARLRGVVRYVEAHDKEADTPTDLHWIDWYPKDLLQRGDATNGLTFNVGPDSRFADGKRLHGVAIFGFKSFPGKTWAVEFIEAGVGHSDHRVRLLDLSKAWATSKDQRIESLIRDNSKISSKDKQEHKKKQDETDEIAAPGKPGHNPWAAMALFMQGMHPSSNAKSGTATTEEDDRALPNFAWKDKKLQDSETGVKWERQSDAERPEEKLSLRAWVEVYHAFGTPVFIVSIGGGYEK